MINIFKGLLNFISKNELKEERKMETQIEEKKDYRFKIDVKKWKAAVDALLAKREEQRANTEKKYWASLDYYYDDKLTKLYSIRAHSRGRIHRRDANLNWSDWRKLPSAKGKEISYGEFSANNGTIKFALTLDDQAAYIGDSWKEYERSAE